MDSVHQPVVEGPRGSHRAEFAEVLDFLNFVFRSNVGRRPSIGGDYPHLYQPENADNFRIIRQDGSIVSCVAIYPAEIQWGDAVLKIGGIGGVSTHPDVRRQGHAGRILQDCIDVMTEQDYDLSILWTGLADYYRRWGWEHAGRQWELAADRSTIGYLPVAPSGEILTDARDERVVDGVFALRSRTKHGIVWNREMAHRMVNAVHKNRVALLVRDGEPVAYILHRGEDVVGVVDQAGDPEAILGLSRMVFGQMNAKKVEWMTRADDGNVGTALVGRGFVPRVTTAGMLLLINPERILRKYGVTDMDVAPAENGWNVTYSGKTVFHTKNDLSKLIFGPERPQNGMSHPVLPLPIFYGDVDHM